MADDSLELEPERSLLRRGRSALARLGFGRRDPDAEDSGGVSLGSAASDTPAIDLDDADARDLGDYELIELVGRGGMGAVYRARQKSLDREVAVKIVATGPWAAEDFVVRFRQEARSAARMQHPNIVTIHEIAAHEGATFFSMEYVRGRSLAQVLQSDGIPPADAAARLVRTLAEAVDYAHRLNVLHLDLKPANILIADDGRPVIADFGLARPLDHALAADQSEVSGTPSYMAPEQVEVQRHRLSRRTDIHGLGAILFELLTGRAPYRGATASETMRLLLSAPVPRPRSVRPSVSRDLDAIAAKCLAKDPGDRYDSARELSDDLARALEERPLSIRRPTLAERLVRYFRREPVSTSGLAVAFVLGLAVILGAFRSWNQLQHERSLRGDTTELLAGAVLSDLPTGAERVDHLLDFDHRFWLPPEDKLAIGESLAQALANRGDTEAARVAWLRSELQRFAAESDEWAGLLDARGTPAALLLAHRYRHESRHGDVAARLARIARAANDDVAILAEVGIECTLRSTHPYRTGDDRSPLCDSEAIARRLVELDPRNLHIRAVAAALGGMDAAAFERDAGLWSSQPMRYEAYEIETRRRFHDELLAVARHRVEGRIAAGGSAEALVDAISVRHQQTLGFGALDQIRAWCTTPEPSIDLGLCSRLAGVLRTDAREYEPRRTALLIERRARGETGDPRKDDPELRRLRWLRAQSWKHLDEVAREPDGRYASILASEGMIAADLDFAKRRGLPLEPPADW